MNNLTTRKIVLGLLMTLVLAFSVQGIADAQIAADLTSRSNTSGDLQTISVGDQFEITFTVRIQEEKYSRRRCTEIR